MQIGRFFEKNVDFLGLKKAKRTNIARHFVHKKFTYYFFEFSTVTWKKLPKMDKLSRQAPFSGVVIHNSVEKLTQNCGKLFSQKFYNRQKTATYFTKKRT